MNQSNPKNTVPIKKIAIATALSFLLFFLIQLILVFSLSGLSHFERYFFVATWLSSVLIALFHSVFFLSFGKQAPLFSALSAALFFLICIGIGFLLKPRFSVIVVLPRAAICTAITPLFAYFLTRSKKQKKKSGNFRFLK